MWAKFETLAMRAERLMRLAMIAGILVLALPMATPAKAESPLFGNVQVINPWNVPVRIYVPQYFDFLGQPTWRQVAVVPANSYIVLPNVMPGTWIGADTEQGIFFAPYVTPILPPGMTSPYQLQLPQRYN